MYLQLFFVAFFSLLCKSSADLRCYACTFSSVDSDRSCLEITNDTHTVECPYTYCTIMRQEYIDPAGEVISFARGCEEDPAYLNHEVADFTFRTFFRACTSDLCNIGNGIQAVVGGNLSPYPEYNGLNLLVPGTANASPFQFSMFLLATLIFTVILL